MGEYVSRLGIALGSTGAAANEPAAKRVDGRSNPTRKHPKYNGGAELAREVGLSHTAVSMKLRAGMTPDQIRAAQSEKKRQKEESAAWMRPGGSVNAPAIITPLSAGVQFEDAPRTVEDLEPKHSAERRKEVALANERELDVAKKKGELIPRLQVAQYISGVVTAARDELMRIGQEKQDDLAGETNPGKCRVIVESAVRHALGKLEAMQHHTFG